MIPTCSLYSALESLRLAMVEKQYPGATVSIDLKVGRGSPAIVWLMWDQNTERKAEMFHGDSPDQVLAEARAWLTQQNDTFAAAIGITPDGQLLSAVDGVLL